MKLMFRLFAMSRRVLLAGSVALLCILPTCLGLRHLPGESALYTERHDEELNLRPLIGVVSQGGDPAPKGSSYIAASYVKFIEAAGARAVPILHDMTRDEVSLLPLPFIFSHIDSHLQGA